MPHFTLPIHPPTNTNTPLPPPNDPYLLSDPPFTGQLPSSRQQTRPGTAIIIDNGSSSIRAGFSHSPTPSLQFPPLMARYTDRKLARRLTFIGSEIYFDGTARGQSKSAYDPPTSSNIINNWDVQEGCLEYIFSKLGLHGQNVDKPVVMTEPLANPAYARRTMSELLFEGFGVPSVAYGVDSLFSYDYNGGRTGLVVGAGYTGTHIIPVVDRQPLLSQATRLDWGRSQCVEFLTRLLRAKYPGLLTGGKITETQIEDLVREHCYVSQDFSGEMLSMLEWSGLENRDHLVQLPYQEKEVVVKTDEELRVAEERKRESGRRLQEQAAKMRLEKLVRKEQELEYYRDLLLRVQNAPTKKSARELLDEDEFKDESQLDRRIKEMEKSVRKQRNKDVGDLEEETAEVHTYPLLEIPDEDLGEEGVKAKRGQRLLKANHDARARAKAEKAAEASRLASVQREDDLYRERDFDGWVEERRAARQSTMQRIKDRDRFKADLGNRKSQASQMRMKALASLASDNPLGRKRRRGQDKEDDGFGADDGDWAVYRDIQRGNDEDGEGDEEEEDLGAVLKGIEGELLKWDPDFTEQSTQEAMRDWTRSLEHGFRHGPYVFDSESARESAQLHLNVERIRVPEVLFQPSIAGVDQAGLTELIETLIGNRMAGHPAQGLLAKDVFVTGGYALFKGFEERLAAELRGVLPVEAGVGVRKARDPVLDAWRGAAAWAGKGGGGGSGSGSGSAFVTRGEWMEKGGEYLKEHNLGNVFT
ncbi:Nuclear actin-protein involved in chromatin remodeling [Elasticomyces elasticus]|nr:Nuclear actin-protein involved in chromatin remodeling [Elasticomyces elasticus]